MQSARQRSSAPRSCCATGDRADAGADGTWNVVTEQGTVKAEHVVNAGGLWAREVGRMVGLELPFSPWSTCIF
jgi:glycine/D-amino acid oxidase-like deaminating enzyme